MAKKPTEAEDALENEVVPLNPFDSEEEGSEDSTDEAIGSTDDIPPGEDRDDFLSQSEE